MSGARAVRRLDGFQVDMVGHVFQTELHQRHLVALSATHSPAKGFQAASGR